MIRNKPFTRQRLDEEQRDDIFTIRFNKEEREELDRFKRLINQSQDSTAIKISLFYASSVLHQEFSGKIGAKLFKKRTLKSGEVVEDNEDL